MDAEYPAGIQDAAQLVPCLLKKHGVAYNFDAAGRGTGTASYEHKAENDPLSQTGPCRIVCPGVSGGTKDRRGLKKAKTQGVSQ